MGVGESNRPLIKGEEYMFTCFAVSILTTFNLLTRRPEFSRFNSFFIVCFGNKILQCKEPNGASVNKRSLFTDSLFKSVKMRTVA